MTDIHIETNKLGACIGKCAFTHPRTHTHVENRETRTKQEKRLKENSSETAELS